MTMQKKKKDGGIAEAWKGLKRTGKNFASRFMFEMFIEEFYGRFLIEMRSALSTISPDDIRYMIANNQYPELPAQVYQAMQGYEGYLKFISVNRLWKAMVEACPELAMAIDSVPNNAGYAWFARFRLRILNGISAGAAPNARGESSVEMVGVTCSQCNRTMIVRKDQVASITECSFCHAPANEPDPEETGSSEEY